jgi:hypothetical protein
VITLDEAERPGSGDPANLDRLTPKEVTPELRREIEARVTGLSTSSRS